MTADSDAALRADSDNVKYHKTPCTMTADSDNVSHNNDASLQRKRRRLAKFRQYLATSLASLLGLAYGTVNGWTSPMAPLLMSDQSPIPEKMNLHTIAWLGSIPNIGAIVCSFFWGTLVDRLGRKTSAVLLSIPFIISWIMVIFANNSSWLLVARMIQGFAYTGAIINVPVFVAEIVQDDLRGLMGVFFCVTNCLGILFAYVVGAYFKYYVLAICCLAIPCIFLVTFIWIPETPMYLWVCGRKEKAKRSLLWYRGGDEDESEKALEKYDLMPKKVEETSLKALFATKGIIKALKIGSMVMVAVPGTGILVFITFATHVFEMSGTSLNPFVASIILATVKVIFTILGSVFVDRVGRRFLVVNSQLTMAIALAVLATYLVLFSNKSTDSGFRWLPILALSVYVAAYSSGLGAVYLVILSEIFPSEIRGLVISKLALINCLVAFVTIKIYPFMIEVIHLYGTFFTYSFLCLLFAIYFYIYLPETKNIPQDAILNLLNGSDVTVRIKKDEVGPLKSGKKANAALYS